MKFFEEWRLVPNECQFLTNQGGSETDSSVIGQASNADWHKLAFSWKVKAIVKQLQCIKNNLFI